MPPPASIASVRTVQSVLLPAVDDKMNTKAMVTLAKEFFDQVPRYDGKGGLPTLNEFIYKFDAFYETAVELYPEQVILRKASSKLRLVH